MVAAESLRRLEGLAACACCDEGVELGCSGIFSISFFAACHASRFWDNMTETAGAHLNTIGSYLLTPVSVTSGHIDCHLPEVRDLLTLETIEIRLNRGTRILQVLRRQMKGILKLRATATPLVKHR